MKCLKGVKEKIEYLNSYGLPQGVRLVPIYDRTELVWHTVNTVERNMVEGAALIFLVLIVFLRRFWASIVVIVVVPLSLLFAFILIDMKHVSANLISLGAIDFGIIVDSAVVLVEAIMVKVTLDMRQKASVAHMRQIHAYDDSGDGPPHPFFEGYSHYRLYTHLHLPASGGKNFFSDGIHAYLRAARFADYQPDPCASTAELSARPAPYESHNPLIRSMERRYLGILEAVLRHPRRLFLGAGIALALSLASWPLIGTEFMPKLDEGNIWLTITLPTPVSLNKAKDLERDIRARLSEFREAKSILTQLGRPEDGTDPKGFNNLEVLIDLKPKKTWRYSDKDELVKAMGQRLEVFPGLQFNFSQVIQDNVEEAISGVKGEIAIKLFGEDLKVLQEKANEITAILRSIEGATDVAAEQQSGLAQLVISIDREKIARFGINIADAEDVIAMAVGGKPATQMLEGERRFDVTVRLVESARDSVGAIENITVLSRGGTRIPLAELAEIKTNQGASRISRENNMRRIAIKCNLIGRDQGGFVAEAQQKISRQVQPAARIPYDMERTIRESGAGHEAAFLYRSSEFYPDFRAAVLDISFGGKCFPDCIECPLFLDRWIDSPVAYGYSLKRIRRGWVYRPVWHSRTERCHSIVANQCTQTRRHLNR